MDGRARRLIDERIRSQQGVIARAQALECGLSRRAIDGLLTTGEWIEVHRGIYAPACMPDTLLHRYSAAAHWAGPTAAISHRSAAAHFGLHGIDSRIVEVTTTGEASKPPGCSSTTPRR